MDLDAFLGIDEEDPRDRLADYIVSADEQLIRDLVALRERRGWSQKDVAERMGIDKSNVSRIERGDGDLLQSTIQRYAMALDAVIRHKVLEFDEVDSARWVHPYFDGGHAEAVAFERGVEQSISTAALPVVAATPDRAHLYG